MSTFNDSTSRSGAKHSASIDDAANFNLTLSNAETDRKGPRAFGANSGQSDAPATQEPRRMAPFIANQGGRGIDRLQLQGLDGGLFNKSVNTPGLNRRARRQSIIYTSQTQNSHFEDQTADADIFDLKTTQRTSIMELSTAQTKRREQGSHMAAARAQRKPWNLRKSLGPIPQRATTSQGGGQQMGSTLMEYWK